MNGKGSKPRSCFSKEFKDNYDDIFLEKYLKKLSDRLYDSGWYTQSHYIMERKNKKECEKYILDHCGEEYLYLLD